MRDIVIVTGASRGIGAAIAEHLSIAGYDVGCISRSGGLPERPDASSETRAHWLPAKADVTDAAALRSAIDGIARGRCVVGLVNNAGLHREGKSSELSLDDWNSVMAANATSVLLGCQAVYPHLAEAGGMIINIGSFFDKLGVKRNTAYCASKAAVGAITRVLAVEWASKAIRVLDVAPGYIVTDLNRDSMEGPLRAYLEKRIPHGRPGDADDVARIVAGLYTIDAAFLTGETIYVDGGQGMAH